MKVEELHEILSKSFNSSISFREVKPQTFQIFLPYYHLDWDMIDVFIQFVWKRIILTDFWQTMMRLSYYTDLSSAWRKKIFETIFSTYTVKYDWKCIFVDFTSVDELYPYLMEIIAVISKVSDISFLKQERAKSIFYEEFDSFMMWDLKDKLKVNIHKNYSPSIDSKNNYPVPYYLESKKPLFVFPVSTNEKCLEAISILFFYDGKKFENTSISVFRDTEEISNKNVWRLMDISDRPLSIFDANNREKMINFAKASIVS